MSCYPFQKVMPIRGNSKLFTTYQANAAPDYNQVVYLPVVALVAELFAAVLSLAARSHALKSLPYLPQQVEQPFASLVLDLKMALTVA